MVKLSTVIATPKMTSDTTPSGEVIFSTFNTTYYAYYAFNQSDSGNYGWTANAKTGYIGYKFTSPIMIGRYIVRSIPLDYLDRSPKDWTFEGSNDGTNWTILDTQVNQIWSSGQVNTEKSYDFINDKKYIYYRLNISANGGNGSFVSVGELKMYEILSEKRMSIKNPTTQKHYSLDNQTLIHLPSSSSKNMILHGIESGKEIKLDEDFDKMKYVKDTSEVLGSGKKFTHVVDSSNVKINKLIL